MTEPCRAPLPLAAATALQDLRALVFRHHALHLEQQVVLGRRADLAVEEDALDAGAAQLVDEQHLVGVTARQAVGRMDVDAVEGAGSREVAQPFQRRADKSGAAVAVVGEAMPGQKGQAVRRDPRLQRRHLAGNGAVTLLLGRHAGIDGNTQGFSHAVAPLPVSHARARCRRTRHVTGCSGFGHRSRASVPGRGLVLVAFSARQGGLPFKDRDQPLERCSDMRLAEPGRLMADPDPQTWNRPAAPGHRRLHIPTGFRRNAGRLPPARPEIPRRMSAEAAREKALQTGQRVVLPDRGRGGQPHAGQPVYEPLPEALVAYTEWRCRAVSLSILLLSFMCP